MVTTVSLAVHVSTSVLLELSLKARSTLSILMSAQSAELALMFVLLRQYTWVSNPTRQITLSIGGRISNGTTSFFYTRQATYRYPVASPPKPLYCHAVTLSEHYSTIAIKHYTPARCAIIHSSFTDSADTVLRNGPNRSAKWAVLHDEMGHFAARFGPFRKPLRPHPETAWAEGLAYFAPFVRVSRRF